jgi:hypothetical protein
MNKDLGGMWQEAVVAYFKAQSRYLPGGTAKNHETSQTVHTVSDPRFKSGTSRI